MPCCVSFFWKLDNESSGYKENIIWVDLKRFDDEFKFPYPINDLGIIGVILLEVIGSLIMIYYFFNGKIDNILIKNICLLFILFMIVVTPLYHPPNKNIIPFLSNLTILGGFILIYTII
mgnify:CR=1 FL=1